MLGSWLVHHVVDRLAARSPRVLYHVPGATRSVALTIDDGPDPRSTPRLLDVLAEHGAKATFFLISSRAERCEDLVARMLAEGHEIGNHMTEDAVSATLDPDEFERDLLEAHHVLSRHATPRWFRPGGAWFHARMLETVERHGYRCALGSVFPFDTVIRWPWFAAAYVCRLTRPGSIIVLHDGPVGGQSVDTLGRALPQLARRDLSVVTLTTLVCSAADGSSR